MRWMPLLGGITIKMEVSPWNRRLASPSCILNEPNSDVEEKTHRDQNNTGDDQTLEEGRRKKRISYAWECAHAPSDHHIWPSGGI